jgi:tight adherence protein C
MTIDPLILAILANPVFIGLMALAMLALAATAITSANKDKHHAAIMKRLSIDKPKSTKKGSKSNTSDKVAKLANKATKYYQTSDPAGIKKLKTMLVQAGFLEPGAVGIFFLSRFGLGIGGTIFGFFAAHAFNFSGEVMMFWATTIGLGLIGYKLPDFYLGFKRKKVIQNNSRGFPDFLDLMSVCANAGMSMEASMERVAQDLMEVYPNLGTNLTICCLEMRAGRPMVDTLASLSERLALEEVRAFATLLQQSKELGSSLSDALAIYSDDMRHKRLLAAEEKAYALPAKLSIPVTGVILPVVLLIAILPVIVRFITGTY